MKTKLSFFALLFLAVLGACQPDDSLESQAFVAAFEKQSYQFTDVAQTQQVTVVFSEAAQSAGTVTIQAEGNGAEYGVDFSTFPAAQNGLIVLPFLAGQDQITFIYNNLMFPYDQDDDQKMVRFKVVAINYPSASNVQGYTTLQFAFSASIGATLLPEIGGPNQGDQVYVDLSTELATTARRDSWDLGFYGGDHFRVAINGSIYMAARNLNVTDIDAVTPASVSAFQSQVAIGTFDPENENYIDAPSGNIQETAIDVVSENNADNKVYLVNLGYEVGTAAAPNGSVAIAGNARGWKKIRILRSGNDYVLQYANLNSNTHQEVTISKNAAYNFTFFSFNTNNVVAVEPEKNKWDLNFTVFTNVIDGAGSYGYSDFVVNNLKGGVKAYRVNVTQSVSYGDFAKADVNDANFTDDQRIIGADWRDVFTGTAYSDRFYVLKDIDGNYYKIRMLGFLSDGGVRGYPKFEYKLLP